MIIKSCFFKKGMTPGGPARPVDVGKLPSSPMVFGAEAKHQQGSLMGSEASRVPPTSTELESPGVELMKVKIFKVPK